MIISGYFLLSFHRISTCWTICEPFGHYSDWYVPRARSSSYHGTFAANVLHITFCATFLVAFHTTAGKTGKFLHSFCLKMWNSNFELIRITNWSKQNLGQQFIQSTGEKIKWIRLISLLQNHLSSLFRLKVRVNRSH